MTVSECGRYLVAGGFDCKVRVFLAHSLERNYVYEAFTSSIRSLHFSHDQRLVCVSAYSMAEYCVLLFSTGTYLQGCRQVVW